MMWFLKQDHNVNHTCCVSRTCLYDGSGMVLNVEDTQRKRHLLHIQAPLAEKQSLLH